MAGPVIRRHPGRVRRSAVVALCLLVVGACGNGASKQPPQAAAAAPEAATATTDAPAATSAPTTTAPAAPTVGGAGPPGPAGPPGVSGYELVTQTESTTVPGDNPTSRLSATATCPAGKRVISGGYDAHYDPDRIGNSIRVVRSSPVGDNAWTALIDLNGWPDRDPSVRLVLVVTAICAITGG